MLDECTINPCWNEDSLTQPDAVYLVFQELVHYIPAVARDWHILPPAIFGRNRPLDRWL